MNKQQIEAHPAWKYISGLSIRDRHQALFGKPRADIEKNFGVTIEQKPYTYLPEVKDDQLAIAVTDSFSNTSCLAVLTPN